MENLRISTITAISQVSSPIDLERVYKEIPINEYIPFIEYGSDNEPRGFSKKLTRKPRKKKIKKIFYNQATMHVTKDNKIMNVKLFNNGKLQITGLKKVQQGRDLIQELIVYLKRFEILKEDVAMINYSIPLINSDFDLKFEIDRETLHKEIVDSGIYSSYEPCIYPGVNIKYFMNQNISNGICNCISLCNGKGKEGGDGDCKKITIAVFKSGKTIITGGQNESQIIQAYQFITTFINERKELFVLK